MRPDPRSACAPRRAAFLALVAIVSGCGRSPHLADGPINLSDRPTLVRLAQPQRASGQTWELCFEFDRPGDSHRASTIHATLVSESGQRASMRTPTLDRRGEAVVCQIGDLTAAEPGAEGVIYESVELSSDVPLRLRGLRGGNRP